MVTVASSGSQTAVINTKHQLYDSTTPAVFVFMVDTANMVIGDRVELSIDVAYASGGSLRQTYSKLYAYGQSDPGKISVPVVSPYQIRFYLKQVAGTGRIFPWAIVAV